MKTISGIHAMVDLLAQSGVRYLFGNPGTTELPLSDALVAEDRLQYILGLHEIPVVAMADGFAQASGRLGVVNVHTCCGLGNAMGMLYNAYRSRTPLLITAGQQDRRLAFQEPILWGRMVEVTRPWTKWAYEVGRIEDLPSAVRRAVQTALTPPTGPVFLALPLDVQMAVAELDLSPPQPPECLVRPPAAVVERAAQTLAEARNPVILVGNRVVEAGAVDALIAVAERLGAPVIHEPPVTHGRCSFPASHPLAAGVLPFWSPDIRARLVDYDVILAAGIQLLNLYIHHEPELALPRHIRIVQIDDNPWELGKNYPVEVAVWGHPRATLAEIDQRLASLLTPQQQRAAMLRAAAHGRLIASERAVLRQKAEEQHALRPMTPLALMESLTRALPCGTAVIEESPTTTQNYLERSGALPTVDGYFAQRGWALGWGLNCAIGVKLAWPARPVLAILGDGSAMYGLQGLWTAARYRIPVTFVVTNNMEYRILKDCARVLDLPAAREGCFHQLDLVGPTIDYVAAARSLGVAARRVTEPDELTEVVRQSLAGDRPQVIEAPVKAAD